jgi:hypothetical protein
VAATNGVSLAAMTRPARPSRRTRADTSRAPHSQLIKDNAAPPSGWGFNIVCWVPCGGDQGGSLLPCKPASRTH